MPVIDPGLARDLAVMREAARAAGALALDMREAAVRNVWDKGHDEPVTAADLAVNTLLEETLRSARPDYGWLSEESADRPADRSAPRIWLVDPIDSTRAFIAGEPHWTIGLSLVELGRPVAGVVYAPETDELFEAQLGGGARRNDAPIFASSHSQLEGARLIANAGLVRAHEGRPAWPVDLVRPKPNSTLLRLARVAMGAADGAVALGRKSDWDLAAGALVVAEAGGRATRHDGTAFQFNRLDPRQPSLVAAGKRLHPLLIERTKHVRLGDPGAGPSAHSAETEAMADTPDSEKQLLHLVIGGELKDVQGVEFEDLSAVDFIGAFPNYRAAYDAWKAAAQRTVDNAEMRYFILHAHRLLDPETGDEHRA